MDHESESDITELYETLPGGREWAANWNNGDPRQLRSGERDPYDPLVRARGNGTLSIDGAGTATVSGASPRIYNYDESQALKWGDVEITVYGRREGELARNSSQGLVIGGRSEHQSTNTDFCSGQTYYARLLFDGRVGFQKELVHHEAVSTHQPTGAIADWAEFGGAYPHGKWIGLKFVIRTLDNEAVALQMYRDLTEGRGGGDWRLVAEFIDTGEWTPDELALAAQLGCESIPPVFTEPATSIFIRNDDVSSMSYRLFSIREIDAGRLAD